MKATKTKKSLALCLLGALLGSFLLGAAVIPSFAAADDVITVPTMLGPDDFTVPKGVLMEKEAKDGFTVSNDTTWDRKIQKIYHMTAAVRVDVDKVPLFTVSVGSCSVQYDISYKAEDGVAHYLNQAKHAADWRWGNNAHTVNMKERHGWTGVHTLTIDLSYIVWDIGPVSEPYSAVNTFSYLGFKEDTMNRVITETTMLTPDDFTVPGTVQMEKTGEWSFAVSNHTTWKQPVQNYYRLTAEVKVDVDKVPLFSVVVLDCAVQYDISYKAEDGVAHYLNQAKDAADWRWGSNGHTVNLKERHGWTGEHKIQIDLGYIAWNTAPTDEIGSYVNNFAYLGFKQIETFTVSELYGNGAILQRDMPIIVSGEAKTGSEVTAKLYKTGEKEPIAENKAAADANGVFTMELPAQKGGYDTYEMVISDGIFTKNVRDLLFGEVWLAGGQSNMLFRLDWSVEGQAMKPEDADDPYLRGFFYAGAPTTWVKGDNLSQISNVSAVGYHFAVILREKLDVPVGVVCNPCGSAQIYSFISTDSLKQNKDLYDFAKGKVGAAPGENYKLRVRPLAGYSVRGLLWYQGESNCGDKAGCYSQAMAILRKEWGDIFGWQDKTMPMVVSHIAPHFYSGEHGFDEPPLLCDELNAIVNAAPDVTAQITIYDLPLDYVSTSKNMTPAPIHPAIKTEVGRRMADSALALVYGIGTEPTAPVYKSMEVKGDELYITFDHVGDGLACLGGELKGFTIRSGKTFVPAHAEIVGKDTVKLSSPYVKNPVAAAYAWTMMNQCSNLVSTVGGKTFCAAVPFRTSVEKNVSYYRPHDWTYCEDEKLWRSTGGEAGFAYAWKSAVGFVSIDAGNAYRGSGAVKLDYTADGEGLISLSPNFNSGLAKNTDFDSDYTKFQVVRFMAKNGSDADLKVTGIRFRDSHGRVYTAPADVTLTKADGWKAIRVEIEGNLTNGTGDAKRTVLKDITDVDFLFEATAGAQGTLYIDDIILSAEIADEPVPEETEEVSENTGTDPESKPFPIAAVAAIAAAAAAAIAAVVVLLKKKKR